MYKRLLVLVLVLLRISVSGQDVHQLEKRYGFKDILLESVPDSVRGAEFEKEFKEKDEFPAKLYLVVHEDYSKIGEVKIREIALKSYKNKIYEIRITTDKDPRLMKALESLYGQAEYDMKNETYFWKTEKLILKFRSVSRNELELLYFSFDVQNMMKEDKKKKVDDIANDF